MCRHRASSFAALLACAAAYVLIVLSTPSTLRAADEEAPPAAPTSAPASAPTSAPVIAPTQDTPRGTLKLLTSSMEHADADAIRSIIHATTPTETKAANLMIDMSTAMAKMRKAAVGAFGEENARAFGDPRAMAAVMRQIDAADEKIDGDHATVTIQGRPPTKLERVDGKWCLPASTIVDGAKPAEVDEQLAEAATQVKVFSDVADDMAAGKFKSVDDAVQTLRNRMMKAANDHQKAASQPTTAPTTEPGQ